MEKYNIKKLTCLIHGFILLSAILAWTACSDLENTYKEFLTKEMVYPEKADSVVIRGGYERAEISWLMLSDPKLAKYKIYWNANRDSTEGVLVKTSGVDTVRVLLDESTISKKINEGNVTFEIFTYDKYGNSSIRVTKTGRIYGEKYLNSLPVRAYSRVSFGTQLSLMINWTPVSDDNILYVELEYLNKQGKKRTLRVDNEVGMTRLTDFPEDGTINYRSAYLPKENDIKALDTLFSTYKTIPAPALPLGKDVLSVPDHEGSIFFSYGLDILQNDAKNGKLVLYKLGGDGTYVKNRTLWDDEGVWSDMNIVFGHGSDRIVGRDNSNNMYMYAFENDYEFLWKKLFGNGFSFKYLVPYDEMFLSIGAEGNVLKWPILPDATWRADLGAQIGSGFEEYTTFTPYNNEVILAVDKGGSLWSIPIADPVIGERKRVGSGWNIYTSILSVGNDIICLDKNGDFWKYEFDLDKIWDLK